MTTETLTAFAPDRPLPSPNAATAHSGHAASLRTPRTLCPHCSSARLTWTQVSGKGQVYSFTIINRAPSPAFAAAVPYVVAVVKLAEGPHLMTNIVDIAPDSVRIGMPVKVVFRKFGDDVVLPMFEPAEAQ